MYWWGWVVEHAITSCILCTLNLKIQLFFLKCKKETLVPSPVIAELCNMFLPRAKFYDQVINLENQRFIREIAIQPYFYIGVTACL